MWVCFNDAFLSIVALRGEPGRLLVRGRIPGDIEAVFPGAKVEETPDRDYRFRTVMAADAVAAALAERTSAIDYVNFKASVQDGTRHDFYARIWGTMREAQRVFCRRQP